MKKTLAVVALAGSLTLLGAGAANAAPSPSPYPGGDVTITVPSGTVVPGQSVTITGSGFAPFEEINITVFRGNPGGTGQSVMASVVVAKTDLSTTADGDGNFTAQVELGDREGTYTITAVGATSGVSSSVQVSVVDDEDDDDDDSDGGWDNDGSDDDNGSDDEDSDDNGSDDEGNGSGNNGSDDEGNGGAGSGNGTGTGVGTTAGGPASLANTGLDSGALMLGGAGVLLLGAGATAVVVSRRKNA